MLERNHRKLVVIDGRVGFTGGLGIADEWLSWRDSKVRIEGSVVRQMQQAFAVHWVEVGGALLPNEEFERTVPAGGINACFISSMDVTGLSHAVWVTHIGLAAAQRRAWLVNPYFVPPPELLAALVERAQAGVDVRLLLPSAKHMDHWWIPMLQRATYATLRKHGVHRMTFLGGATGSNSSVQPVPIRPFLPRG